MPRTKKINPTVQYGNTGWIINDCGNGQFELYNTSTKQILAKSNNPLDFDKHIDKILVRRRLDVFEIFKLNKKKAVIKENIALLEAKQKAMQEKIKELDELTTSSQNKADCVEIAVNEAQAVLDALNGQIHMIEEMQDYNIPYYQDSLDELEHRRYELQSKIKSAVNAGLYRIEQGYRLDGSDRRGKEMQDVYGRGLIYSCNAYIDSKEKSVTANNVAKSKELIKNKFNSYQSKANKVGLALNAEYVKARLDMLDINLAIKVKQKEEKARIREEKRRLREQEQLLAEAEREKAELQKERRMYEQSLRRTLNAEERAKFEATLRAIDKRIADIDYRVNNAKAGYLYITATPAMPNCCKLGVTRRLQPLRRISELSSASVPFPFVCYGLVFDDDVFDLETRVHDYFDDKRVNKENKHKEFFYVSPKEAIDVLRNEFHVDVHFVDEDCDENEEDE
jgi:hypothetical protein